MYLCTVLMSSTLNSFFFFSYFLSEKFRLISCARTLSFKFVLCPQKWLDFPFLVLHLLFCLLIVLFFFFLFDLSSLLLLLLLFHHRSTLFIVNFLFLLLIRLLLLALSCSSFSYSSSTYSKLKQVLTKKGMLRGIFSLSLKKIRDILPLSKKLKKIFPLSLSLSFIFLPFLLFSYLILLFSCFSPSAGLSSISLSVNSVLVCLNSTFNPLNLIREREIRERKKHVLGTKNVRKEKEKHEK
jgi:hypothetical protein